MSRKSGVLRPDRLKKVSLVALVAAMVFVNGCKSASKKDDGGVPTAPAADENSGDSDSGKAMGLHSIHYAFDSSSLTAEAKGKLKENAAILKSKSSVKIQIEGHCDRKGGIQYNIALGERRANAAKKFLEDQGISGNRITTISFGKEKLLDSAATEEADAKNRRANFVITSH